MMLGSKPDWAKVEGRPGNARFDAYPDVSLAEWHEAPRLGRRRRPSRRPGRGVTRDRAPAEVRAGHAARYCGSIPTHPRCR